MKKLLTNPSVTYRALRLMRIISENAQRTLEQRLPSTLTSRQFEVLNRLYFLGEQTLSELATVVEVSAASMSQMVARLRAGGVVETAAKSNDARAKLVRITEKGKGILESTAQLLQPDFQAVEHALGSKRLQSLLEELEAVHDAFSATNLALED